LPSRFAHFKKHALSGTLLSEKNKAQPLLSAIALQFETFARALENKRSQWYSGF